MTDHVLRASLGEQAAFQLANVTKTPPQFGAITPRWLVRFLDWKPLEAGTLRVNKVNESKVIESLCSHEDESPLPATFADYQDAPREYRLSSINALLNVHTRVSDLFSNPYDQVREQLRLVIESVKEKQESELLNNADYGLLNNVADSQKIKTRKGAPTPDDLDELLTKVWKEPSLFLAHPSDKIAIRNKDQKSKILLVRVGEKKQGVIGLFQPGLPGEQSPGLSVRFMGIDQRSLASYLISLYCSAAVLTDDAIALLEDVDVGQYHEYK